VRYRAVVATRNPDAFDHAFTGDGLDELRDEAVNKPVSLLFAEAVGIVEETEQVENGVEIIFETVRELIGAGELYCVPAFVDGKLYSFGLVPVPADSSLSPVEVVE